MMIRQHMPWPDQEARTPVPPLLGTVRNFQLNLDDGPQGIRLEFLWAGDRLAGISEVDRDSRNWTIELEVQDSDARKMPDLLQPYNLGSQAPIGSRFSVRMLTQLELQR